MAREAHRSSDIDPVPVPCFKKKKNRSMSFPHAAQELLPDPEEDAEEVFEKHGEADHAVPARVNSAEFLR